MQDLQCRRLQVQSTSLKHIWRRCWSSDSDQKDRFVDWIGAWIWNTSSCSGGCERHTQAHFRHFLQHVHWGAAALYGQSLSGMDTKSTHTRTCTHFPFSRERADCMKDWWVISCVQEHTAVQFSHTAPEGPSAFVQTMWINIWTCSDDEYVSSGSFTLLLQRCQEFTTKRGLTLKWDRQTQGI